MNGWDLIEILFPVLGMVAAVNLLIQFFQIAWEEFRRCSIIRAEQKMTQTEQKNQKFMEMIHSYGNSDRSGRRNYFNCGG